MRDRTKCFAIIGMGLTISSIAWHVPASDDSKALEKARLGGDTTVDNASPAAFEQQAPELARMQKLLFSVGDSFFNQNWVAAPASTTARDGLGPMFNARSCAGCHFKDGRGQVATDRSGKQSSGFLVRLALDERDEYGAYLPEPNYGGQFQDQSIGGVRSEGNVVVDHGIVPGVFGDGTSFELQVPFYRFKDLAYGPMHDDVTLSPRVANHVIGMGLLEAVPEETVLALADPDDSDGDGISGRPNRVYDVIANETRLGRFGWKANQPTLLQQVAGAFSGDMGITTRVFTESHCARVQADCISAAHGGAPEIDDDDLDKVVLYVSSLGVPAQREPQNPGVRRGEALFHEANCSGCHVSELKTGEHEIEAVAHQTIRPFTDLLLHDMGEGLADGQGDFEASGSEWRTPPLWGIGLFETVNGHTNYLHDGRARNLSEAILWHGGEAEASREAFRQMKLTDREQLLAFLGSL